MNKILFEEYTRKLVANVGGIISVMEDFAKDEYIILTDEMWVNLIKSREAFNKLKEILNPEQNKEIKKWDQIPLPLKEE